MSHWTRKWPQSQTRPEPDTQEQNDPISRLTNIDANWSAEKKEQCRKALGLLTTAEAADVLRLSARTLERYRVTGGGPKYNKLGPGKRARVVYWREALVEWLRKHEHDNTSDYGS